MRMSFVKRSRTGQAFEVDAVVDTPGKVAVETTSQKMKTEEQDAEDDDVRDTDGDEDSVEEEEDQESVTEPSDRPLSVDDDDVVSGKILY